MAIKEKELQEEYERIKNQSTILSAEVDTTSPFEEMSQVKLEEVDLTRLKQQNQNLEDIYLKKEEEKKKLEEIC